ncbi:MAG: hypothetical protein K0B37_17060 [Bacteroidales bacterium]|nr:hypothetical protein [Bacteroidales bacterium]
MKNLIKASVFLLFVVILGAGCEKVEDTNEVERDEDPNAEERFYYAFDEKVPLIIKPNTILVKYIEGTRKTEIEKSVSRFTKNYTIKWHGTLIAEISVSSQKLADELAEKLKQNNKVYTCQPFYTLKDGLDMGVTDEILVHFLPDVNEDQIRELQDLFSISLIKTTKIYQKYRVSRGADALEIANRIFESGLTEFATPNFISYGYYAGGSKIFLKHSLCEVLIEFKQSDITAEKAKSHLKKFSFINTGLFSVNRPILVRND